MARVVHNKWFVKSYSFLLDLVAQNVQQCKIKGEYVALPRSMARFSIKNTMSTGKLKNMTFKVSDFWDEKRPTKN